MSRADPRDPVPGAAVRGGAVAGVTAMIVARNRTPHAGSAGERALGYRAPMTPDDAELLASMTKIAAMRLAEDGRVGPYAPAAAYMLRIERPEVPDGRRDGAPVPRAPARPITVRPKDTTSRAGPARSGARRRHGGTPMPASRAGPRAIPRR